MVQVPIHTKCQTMLVDKSVMLKYNISIVESEWIVIVCISSVSINQLMLVLLETMEDYTSSHNLRKSSRI